MDKIINKIAKECFNRDTLKTQNSDNLDFFEVSVWSVKEALEKAFLAGKNPNQTKKVILKFLYTESGFCRTHFKTKNEKGQILFYCIMEEDKDTVGLYRCTEDGEPSHPVTFYCELEIETPFDDYGRSLLKKFNDNKE